MDENLTTGEVIRGTFGTISVNAGPYAVYVAAVTAIGVLLEWGMATSAGFLVDTGSSTAMIQNFLGLGMGLSGLVVFVVTLIGQYLLWQAALDGAGLGRQMASNRYLAFFGQAVLMAVAVAFGYLLLIVPGLILTARWSVAPAFLIGEDEGVIEAMRSSWATVSGNTTPVVLAIVLAAIVVTLLSLTLVGGSMFASGFGEEASFQTPGLAPTLFGHLLQTVTTALTVALGVFLFGRLHGQAGRMNEVFS